MSRAWLASVCLLATASSCWMRYSASFCSAVCSTCAVCARIAAVLLAMSRCCAELRLALGAFRSSAWSGGLRGPAGRCSTSVVRTIWLRSCSRSLVILVSVVRPWASKKLLGLKCLMSLWSSRVSGTDSSSRPLFWMSAPTASCTALTKVARCSCRFLEVHGGGDRAQAVDEFGLDQLAQLAGVVGAAAQRLRGERDRGSCRV